MRNIIITMQKIKIIVIIYLISKDNVKIINQFLHNSYHANLHE